MADMSGFDLRKFQEEGAEQEKIKSIMGKILSGRDGYEAVIEKKQEKEKRCKNCNWVLANAEKFCPECGTKC
jgi:rRNA maturation endonuclease Nob1